MLLRAVRSSYAFVRCDRPGVGGQRGSLVINLISEFTMLTRSESSNVVNLAAYRFANAGKRPPRPAVLWYPGVGYVRAAGAASVSSLNLRAARRLR